MSQHVFHETAAVRPYAKSAKCDKCKGRFIMAAGGWKVTPIVVVEQRDSNFRGEDDVKFYHPGCWREIQNEGGEEMNTQHQSRTQATLDALKWAFTNRADHKITGLELYQRGCGLRYGSAVDKLRNKGWHIECRQWNENGVQHSEFWLMSLERDDEYAKQRAANKARPLSDAACLALIQDFSNRLRVLIQIEARDGLFISQPAALAAVRRAELEAESKYKPKEKAA